jgi:hypothetical protein
MSKEEMLKKLIECVDNMFEAKKKYEAHPGGGASQKIKNKLACEYKQRLTELGNASFNIKQHLK